MNDRLRQQRDTLALGGFTIDLQQGELLDVAGHRVALRRQSLLVLLELARQPGLVLTRKALAASVWKNVRVTDDSLVQCMVEIRRALGPVAGAAMKTVPRRGYLLEIDGAATVSSPTASSAAPIPPPAGDVAEAVASLHPVRPHELPFVGRQAEVDQLARRAGDAGVPKSGLMLISGEPGIGKSRLIDEAAATATTRGATVVALKCHEIESGIAYGALSQFVDRLVTQTDGATLHLLDNTSRAELAALVPWCSERLAPLVPLDAAEANLRQTRLRAALIHLCRVVGSRRSLIICIDDAHWLDEASAVTLFAVVEAAAKQTFTFWATLRDDEIARNPNAVRLVAALEELPGTVRLPLKRLAPEHIEHIVRHVHPAGDGQAVDSALVDRLVRESAGNPFYLRELLHAALPGGGGVPAPSEGSASDSAPVLPRGILEAVLRRARHLPKPAMRLLEGGAVLEQSASFDVLCAAAKLERHAGLEALEVLMSTGWLVEDRERGRYPFAHDKLREAIYVSLPAALLRVLHGRAAHALLDDAKQLELAPEHAVVATHAHRAGLGALAFAQFALAGDAARRLFELRRAEALYSQALGLDMHAAEQSAVPQRVALLEKRGAVRSMLGSGAAAESDLRQAIELVRLPRIDGEHDSRTTQMRLHLELGVTLQRHHRLEDALAALGLALDLAAALGDDATAAAAHSWMGDVEWMRERFRTAQEHFSAVLAMRQAALSGAPTDVTGAAVEAWKTKALFGLAQCASMDARPAQVDAWLDRGLARVHPPGDLPYRCASGLLRGLIRVGAHGLNEPAVALDHFEHCRRLANEADMFWYAMPCEIGSAVAYATLRRHDTAIERLEATLRLPADAHNGRWQMSAGVWLAWTHLQAGDADAALKAARQAQRALAEFGAFMFAGMLPALVAHALAQLNRADEVEDPRQLVEAARRENMGYAIIAALEARAAWLHARADMPRLRECANELLMEASERGLPLARAVAEQWRKRAEAAAGCKLADFLSTPVDTLMPHGHPHGDRESNLAPSSGNPQRIRRAST